MRTGTMPLRRMGTNANWADLAAQAVFHTLVASLFIEALVRSWRMREPRQRMVLRLLALGYPLVLFPALVLLFPFRGDEVFRDEWALFDGRRWDDVTFLGVGLFRWWLVAFVSAGVTMFLLDLVPLVSARRRPGPVPAEPDPESAAVIGEELPAVAAALGVRAPPIVFLARDQPVLFCTGVRRHTIVVSRGAVRLLDRDELRAALAHELAHLARHDPAASWAVMGLRAIMFFNPAFQVVSRALARDAEWLADDRAASASGDRLALASGLIKLHRASGGAAPVRRTLPFAAALSEPLARVRSFDVELRCRRLLDDPPVPLRWGAARVALAGASLTALLFFVV
jgi:Zn-dependent protease with chaperone function